MMKLGETWSQIHLGVHLSLQKAKAAYCDTYEQELIINLNKYMFRTHPSDTHCL